MKRVFPKVISKSPKKRTNKAVALFLAGITMMSSTLLPASRILPGSGIAAEAASVKNVIAVMGSSLGDTSRVSAPVPSSTDYLSKSHSIESIKLAGLSDVSAKAQSETLEDLQFSTMSLEDGIDAAYDPATGDNLYYEEIGAGSSNDSEIVSFYLATYSELHIYSRNDIYDISSEMPSYIKAIRADGSDVVIPVNWECGEEDLEKYYCYQFNPVWDRDRYPVADHLLDQIPFYCVFVEAYEETEEVPRSLNINETGKASELKYEKESEAEEINTQADGNSAEEKSNFDEQSSGPGINSVSANSLEGYPSSDETAEQQYDGSEAAVICGDLFTAMASSNEQQIFDYLTKTMKLNSAAACGVLANIYYESGFNPTAKGDMQNGVYTSYGICQWHAGRWEALKTYCKNNGLSADSLSGQLRFMEHELKTGYTKVYNTLISVDNSADGAKTAAKSWCLYYEIPANKEARAIERANLAIYRFWPDHATETAPFTTAYAGKYKVATQNDPLNMRQKASASSASIAKIPKGTIVDVVSGNGTWAKVKYNGLTGYCAMGYLKRVTEYYGYKLTMKGEHIFGDRYFAISVSPYMSSCQEIILTFTSPDNTKYQISMGTKTSDYFIVPRGLGEGSNQMVGKWTVSADLYYGADKSKVYHGADMGGVLSFNYEKAVTGLSFRAYDSTGQTPTGSIPSLPEDKRITITEGAENTGSSRITDTMEIEYGLTGKILLQAYPEYYREPSDTADKALTWKIVSQSTSSAASITASKKNGSAVMTIKKAGVIRVRATSPDSGYSRDLVITAKDHQPRIPVKSLSLNNASGSGAVIFEAIARDGNTVRDIRIASVSKGKAVLGDDKVGDFFTLTGSSVNENNRILKAGDKLTTGTYSLQLIPVTDLGEYSLSPVKMTVKVVKTLPKVSFKKLSSPNLYMQDSRALYRISSPAEIESVTDNSSADTVGMVLEEGSYNKTDGTISLRAQNYAISREATGIKSRPSFNKKVRLTISYADERVVTKTLTVSTKLTKPVSPETAVVELYNDRPYMELDLTDKASGKLQNVPSGISIASADGKIAKVEGDLSEAGYSSSGFALKDMGDGKYLIGAIEGAAYKNGSYKLKAESPAWTKPVTFNVKVSYKKKNMPIRSSIITSKTVYKVNCADTGGMIPQLIIPVKAGCGMDYKDHDLVVLTGKEAGGPADGVEIDAVWDKEKSALKISPVMGIEEIKTLKNPYQKVKLVYSYETTVKKNGSPKTVTKTASKTIRINYECSVKKLVSIKSSGSINTIARDTTAMTIKTGINYDNTVKIESVDIKEGLYLPIRADDGRVIPGDISYKDAFKISSNEKGIYTLSALYETKADSREIPLFVTGRKDTGISYEPVLEISLSDGTVINTKFKIKTVYKVPKVKASVSTMTMYISSNSERDIWVKRSGTYKEQDGRIESVSLSGQGMDVIAARFHPEDKELLGLTLKDGIEDARLLKYNNTKITAYVRFKGACSADAAAQKPAKVNLKIKISR
ncbi:phage tail tip lysozyme [Butyrivibrio sp. MC2013]|uniref:phage tail tip lysozyme n=1 Tax=Butyrivibrio sp. MC2013 TaxID=1280686 RepID=UPI000407AC7D|nr:phage tail tip lysozyme [Butyrivibrio sp. MC2013]